MQHADQSAFTTVTSKCSIRFSSPLCSRTSSTPYLSNPGGTAIQNMDLNIGPLHILIFAASFLVNLHTGNQLSACRAIMADTTNNTKELLQTNNTKELLQTNKTKELLQTNNTKELLLTNKTKELLQTNNTKELLQTNNTKELLQTNNTKELLLTNNTKELLQTNNTKELLQTTPNAEPNSRNQ